ncbi:DUF4253 domain-containing protein [Micromonospora echinaurantiaca]|uniref:DUF4253 domain-containing protein n=1 Tax=Micromonospora echinaurantiaca TaxID=47857 RepID=UPI003795EBE5
MEHFADQYADMLSTGQARLALVPAIDGAHALAAIGWTGPLNHDNDTARFAAVVRDWQRRFGATVVGLGFDTLHLSVAAPPVTLDLALQVTAEHFAFLPGQHLAEQHRHFPQVRRSDPGLELQEFLVGLTSAATAGNVPASAQRAAGCRTGLIIGGAKMAGSGNRHWSQPRRRPARGMPSSPPPHATRSTSVP